jgi:hypothetical protein
MTNPSVGPNFSHARWRKSSRSQNAGACVEVAALNAVVGIRDSKDPHGAVLALSPTQWQNFTRGIKNDQFDL